MGIVDWYVIVVIALIFFVILTWCRIKIILGGPLRRIMTSRQTWGLTLGIISALLASASLIMLLVNAPRGALPEWVTAYYSERIKLTASTAAIAIIGIAGGFLDGLVGQEGIYRGRIYTWDQMLDYRTAENVLYIGTTKTNWLGRPKQIKWDLQHRKNVVDLVTTLERRGISRRQ